MMSGMKIDYKHDVTPSAEQIIDVYQSSGINRPISDIERIKEMYSNSNLILTAWDKDKLIGVSRALTDFCYCCYLSDLAVRKEYQKSGVGKKLIQLTKERLGEKVSLILLASPSAVDYYPKLGMKKINNGFTIKRTE